MTVNRIEIRNFKLHRKLDISLSPTVTTIIGPSFAGKSTVIKALKWAATNKPSGDNIVRWGAAKASVRLTVDDGHHIIRSKGKSLNVYKLDDHNYKAFGTDVPDPIQELMNVNSINLQYQFDTPFWFSESAGEVSKQLNAIINLEIIDQTLANLASVVRKTKVLSEDSQNRIKAHKNQIEEWSYVEDMDEDLVDLEALAKRIAQKTSEKLSLETFVQNALKARSTKKRARAFILDAKKALVAAKDMEKLTSKAENLQKSLEILQSCQRQLDRRPPSLEPLRGMIKEGKALRKKKNHLDELLIQMIEKIESRNEWAVRAKELKAKLKTKIGKACPLCQKPQTT
jgi:DNA repair protein SbcC/Rad50